jgi:biopolymer transport protein TolQ
MGRQLYRHYERRFLTLLDQISLATDGSTLSPIALFLQADWVVKTVMIGLFIAAIYVWGVIIGFGMTVGKVMKSSDRFERDFWRAGNIDKFHEEQGKVELPSARVLAAGIAEWRRSTAGKSIDRDGTRERLGIAMNAAVAAEVDRLADRIGILATIGAVAPFVGLFGTVWGIMDSLSGFKDGAISIGTVAPQLAEALFATAIGLFAAIPAVIAYNSFSQRLNRLESRLGRFGDGLHATFSRELEAE